LTKKQLHHSYAEVYSGYLKIIGRLKSHEIKIMGTRELGKKSSSEKTSPVRKSSEKSDEKLSEAPLKKIEDQPGAGSMDQLPESNIFQKVKFEVYGEEMISKEVKQSGNSGRVYLPPDWIGKHLKIIRID